MVIRMSSKKIQGTTENWENGKLGLDEKHVKRTSQEEMAAMQAALGMKAISIRLPVQLIEAMKAIAAHHGIGYQPLMRDVLQRFARAEMRRIYNELEQRQNLMADSPAESYFEREEQDEQGPAAATG